MTLNVQQHLLSKMICDNALTSRVNFLIHLHQFACFNPICLPKFYEYPLRTKSSCMIISIAISKNQLHQYLHSFESPNDLFYCMLHVPKHHQQSQHHFIHKPNTYSYQFVLINDDQSLPTFFSICEPLGQPNASLWLIFYTQNCHHKNQSNRWVYNRLPASKWLSINWGINQWFSCWKWFIHIRKTS